MILFHIETSFQLKGKRKIKKWISCLARKHGYEIGDINYVFYSDEQLLEVNKKYLHHNTYTDIITFDYSENITISGDIMISIDRVKENAIQFNVSFEQELLRVLAHGILHLCGFKDATTLEEHMMRENENQAIIMFNNLDANC